MTTFDSTTFEIGMVYNILSLLKNIGVQIHARKFIKI